VFYGLIYEFGNKEVNKIARISPQGAVLSYIQLSHNLPKAFTPERKVQLFKPSHEFVILVSSHYQRGGRGREGRIVKSRMFLVDPETGRIGQVELKKPV
jgi:hypothetical protein